MNWNKLTTVDQLDQLSTTSSSIPVLVFKHSTRCSISAVAKWRLEEAWKFSEETILPYLLDLIEHRDVSNEIAQRWNIIHESPQILVLHDAKVIHHASHLDINVDEIAQEISGIA